MKLDFPQHGMGSWDHLHRWLQSLWNFLGNDIDAPMYGDLFCGGNQCEDPSGGRTYVAPGTNVDIPKMPTGAGTEAVASFRLPNDYRNGTDLAPYVSWCPATTDAGNVYILARVLASVDGSVLAELTAESVESAASETAWTPTRVDFTAASGTGLTKGATVLVLARRRGTRAEDTLGDSAGLLGIGLKYQREGIGNEKAHP